MRLKAELLRYAKRMGVFEWAARASIGDVRILCYHGTWRVGGPFPGDAMFIRLETFARRLELIRAMGYKVVSLDEAAAILRGDEVTKQPAVVITIDDGWYGTLADMLPALERHAMPATLYCDTHNLEQGLPIAHVLAQYLPIIAGRDATGPQFAPLWRGAMDLTRPMAERLESAKRLARALDVDLEPLLATRTFSYMTPQELAEAARRGLDIELHTHHHTLSDMSRKAISKEIALNRDALGQMLARPQASFRHFCYPSGRHLVETADVLADLGIATATTVECRLARAGDNPRLLPRIIDGGHISEIEFEAELSGFVPLVLGALRLRRRQTQSEVGSVAAART
jgi:peptidoglycan/xylan/chitin deacetylase (PgdA/CDA1 family)